MRSSALAALLFAGALLAGCASGGDDAALREFTPEEQALVEDTTITPDELAGADCRAGAECWIAVDGVVYDVASVSGWNAGETHHGVGAGTDATEELGTSPHGAGMLAKLPVVGGLGD